VQTKTNDAKKKDLALVLRLNDEDCANENIVGGKAASLAKMTELLKSNDIPELKDVVVPRGIVLTSKALKVRSY